MLRNTGIRSKILAVLALPVLVLVLAAAVISTGATRDAERASRVEVLVHATPELTKLVRGLQAERALTARVLAGDASRTEQLQQVRAAVTAGIEALEQEIASVDLDAADASSRDAVLQAQQANQRVEAIRAGVDGGSMTADLAVKGYTEVITAGIEVAGLVGAGQEDPELSAALRSYSAVERLVELVMLERDLTARAVAAGTMPAEMRAHLHGVMAQQQVARDEAISLARAVAVGIPEVPANDLKLARARTLDDADGVLEGIDVEAWTEATQAEVDTLTAVENQLAAAAAERTEVLTSEARDYAWRISAITALLVVLPVLLALFIARLITRPLRRLTEAATQLREQLPAMVEQMHTPGEGPALELPEIPVGTDDEIGRLASAFNDVNRTTVQVAREQAALRGSIAAMFVNVARRDQVLLSRQLAFIDQLERTEENPTTLENLFKLDHLATRMRRNAESLLVLAGIDTGRRLRRPMPLSDVVRTASSEIEHYDRVDLVLQTDPPMVGHVALTAAHLLAELLENATNFSDPGSRVVVSTAPGRRGVVVTIADEGLGMSPEEIRQANARIAEPPIAEVVGAQRLGFFVVGRLARRLGAKVTLTAARERGTIVRIELPAVLFSPGTVVELPGHDVAPEEPVDVVRPVQHDEPAAQTPPAPRRAPAPAAELPAQRTSDSPLPRRGAGSPAAPVAEGAAEPAPEPPVFEASPGDVLPKRRPATDAPASEAGRASGLFGSFRARRPGEPEEGGETAAAPREATRPEASRPEPARPEPARAEPRPADPAPSPSAASKAPAVDQEQQPSPQERQDLAAQLSALQTRPAPAQPAPVRPAPAPSGAAALDILPSRKGGGSARRFGRRKEVAPAPVTPMSRRELRTPETPVPAPAATPAQRSVTAPVTPAAPAPVPAQGAGDASRAPHHSPDAPAAPLPVRAGSPVASPRIPQVAAPVAAPVPVAEGMGDVLRQRSALASEALTELSRLSTYSPAAVDTKPPATLTRRTPAATPAAEVAPTRTAPANRPTRNAADVRSMLSGFQAGVERGRTTTAEPSDASAPAAPAERSGTPRLTPTTDTPRPTGGQA